MEAVELDEARERRVAEQLAVELQPARLLGQPSARHLYVVARDAEPVHRLDQGPPILVDLGGKALEEGSELGPLVARGGALHQLDARCRAGEVVVQVDRCVLAVEGHADGSTQDGRHEPRFRRAGPGQACLDTFQTRGSEHDPANRPVAD